MFVDSSETVLKQLSITAIEFVSFQALFYQPRCTEEALYYKATQKEVCYTSSSASTLLTLVSDIAIFVLKRDVKLQLTN